MNTTDFSWQNKSQAAVAARSLRKMAGPGAAELR